MKPVNEWTRDDLEKLIAEDIRESLTLDYKSSASLGKESKQRNELSKDVSAFANSAGGIIVYGVVEKGQKPDRIDDGCDDASISREWLEQTIGTLIQPRIQGIVIRQIPLAEGRSAYAVSIPQATSLAPHQANDNKYYRRFNFESVPMADYEIRDTLRRASTPDLFLVYEWSPFELLTEGLRTTLNVAMGNRSPEPSFYTSVDMIFDHEAVVAEETGAWARSETRATLMGQEQPVIAFHRNLTVPHHQPIFKERLWNLGTFKIIIDRSMLYGMGHLIACPGFNLSKAGILRARGGTPSFVEHS